MTEVTVETFKEAIAQSQVVVGEVDPDDRTKLREKIRGILLNEDAGGTAERVARKVAIMLWPERDTEIKRKKAEIRIEKDAIMQIVQEELKLMLESRGG